MTPGAARLPSIDGLSAFEASARLGSFERAASELHVTASAVSKRVATLEDLLGTPLLTRGPKALSLTPTGKEYLVEVRIALDHLQRIPLHQRASQRIDRLSLSMLPTFARQILMPRLYEYLDAHPEVDLEVVIGVPFLDVAGVDAHLELRHGRPDAGARALMDDVVIPVATPALLTELALREPEDLARAPLIRCPLEPWSPWLQAAGLNPTEPTAGPRLVDVGLMYEAALQDQGVALARPSLIRPWLRRGELVPVLPLAVRSVYQYYLVQPLRGDVAMGFGAWLEGVCKEAAEAGLHALSQRCGKTFRVL